jgi:hypothetical protein
VDVAFLTALGPFFGPFFLLKDSAIGEANSGEVVLGIDNPEKKT